MTRSKQYDLWGGSVLSGDIAAKVEALLEDQPDARDSYAELVGLYWFVYDGLDRILPPDCHDAFMRFMNRATSWKTIQNRAMEIQRRRPDLDASPDVRDKRNRQATQGAVR